MGTKVHSESYFPGFYSMRDLNENSSNSNWPLFCGDKIVPNGQYYNGFVPRTLVDDYSGYDKDTLKQKMLEHEAVFKNQVCELHRVYRIQRDMMEDAKRKEIYYRASVEPASSSSHQVPSEDAQKWHMAGFPLLNSSYGRTSIGGAENFSSPLSCTKGITAQPNQSPFQNGSTSKDFEMSTSRPLKVRKKLFDLQLPPDQYEDLEEEENQHDYKESDLSSCTRDGYPNSRVNKKIDCAMDVSASVSRSKGSTGLADLNEPIQIEEAIAPSSVDFLGRSSGNVETAAVHHFGNGYLMHSSSESQINDRGWLSHLNRAGSSRGNLSSAAQGYQPDKLPLSHPAKGTYPSGYGREDLWREGFRHGLESSRSYDQSTNSHLETIASRTPSSYPFFSSSSFASSWAHPISSWAKPTNSFTQNVEPSANAAATMSRTLHPSAPSNEYFGGKWGDCSSSSRSIPGFASESKLNGLSAGFDYLNCSGGDNVASNRSTNHGFRKFPNADSKPVIDINLNETLIAQDLSTPHGKSRTEDVFQTLPWLKPKPVHVKEVSVTSRSELSRDLSSLRSSNQLCCQNEVRDLNELFPSKTSCHSEISRKTETSQTQHVQKILGVPIFERDVPEKVPSFHASTIDCHSEGNIVSNERKKVIIDINVACEPDEQMDIEEVNVTKEKRQKSASFNCFDLNSCASDTEDSPIPCSERNNTLEIDLEAPVFLESEDDSTQSKEKMSDEIPSKHEQIQDEVVRNIAETLVSISSSNPSAEDSSICLPSEASVEEALVWFVNVVSSCKSDSSGKESRTSDDEMDEFETMTLQLVETREEDYMPTPFVPEIQETGGTSTLATRPRRGNSRRGRHRRDFQRDILPGLTSLSRHEVTEDLQTFGGLMRATGHSWNSGVNRRNGTRNGGGRGRRRAVAETVPVSIPIPIPVCTPLIQQLNTIEGGLEDRSLTGWGKTTRRPRRQRCHAAGNPATVALT